MSAKTATKPNSVLTEDPPIVRVLKLEPSEEDGCRAAEFVGIAVYWNLSSQPTEALVREFLEYLQGLDHVPDLEIDDDDE